MTGRVKAGIGAVQAKIREERKAREDAKAEGKGKKPLIPPFLSKPFQKAKAWLSAPDDLLKTLARIGPAALAAVLGPALAISGTALYAMANEREDSQQVSTSEYDPEIAVINERLGALEDTVAALPEPTPVPDVRPDIAELAERVSGLEGINPDDITRLDQVVAALGNRPPVTLPPIPPTSLDLSGLEGSIAEQSDALTAQEARLAAVDDMLDQAATLEELAAAVDASEAATGQKVAALKVEKDADVAELQDLIDLIGTFDPSSLEAAIAALEASDVTISADMEAAIATLEAADTALSTEAEAALAGAVTALTEADAEITADTEAALAEAVAALTQADAALAAAEVAQAEIASVQADLDDVETVFFASLTQQWAAGLPVSLTINNGCSGTSAIFARTGGAFVAAVRSPSGSPTTFCVRFTPVPPTLPAACRFTTPTGSLVLNYDTSLKTLAATNAVSATSSQFFDESTEIDGGTSGSFSLQLTQPEGATSKTSPAGAQLSFAPKTLNWVGMSYELRASLRMASTTGSSPSVAAFVETVTARVEGAITCTP